MNRSPLYTIYAPSAYLTLFTSSPNPWKWQMPSAFLGKERKGQQDDALQKYSKLINFFSKVLFAHSCLGPKPTHTTVSALVVLILLTAGHLERLSYMSGITCEADLTRNCRNSSLAKEARAHRRAHRHLDIYWVFSTVSQWSTLRWPGKASLRSITTWAWLHLLHNEE